MVGSAETIVGIVAVVLALPPALLVVWRILRGNRERGRLPVVEYRPHRLTIATSGENPTSFLIDCSHIDKPADLHRVANLPQYPARALLRQSQSLSAATAPPGPGIPRTLTW